jgi:hypothetical protein
MRWRTKRLMAWVAVAVLGGFVAPHAAVAQSASNNVGIRLLDAPVNRGNDPRARVYIVDQLAPGATIHRRIEVANSGSDRLTVQLYAAGAQVDQGGFKPLDGHTADDLSGWTTVTPSSVDLAPNSKTTATIDVAVPPDAPGGERYAAVWAELPPTRSHGVTSVNRVGLRMYLSVGGDAEPASDFTVNDLRAGRDNAGHKLVTAAVTNTGGRAVDVAGQLQLASPGLNAGPFPSTGATTLAPTQQATMSIPVQPQMSRGPWDATLTATSGNLSRTATGRLLFIGAPRHTAGSDYGWLLWLLVAAPAALIIVGGILIALQRRAASSAV